MAAPLRAAPAAPAPDDLAAGHVDARPSPARLVFGRGVLLVGLPVALLLDALLLWGRDELGTWLSVEHALQLALFVPAIALAVGGLLGSALARRTWLPDEARAEPDDEDADPHAIDSASLDALAVRLRAMATDEPGRFAREARMMVILGYAYSLSVGIGLLVIAFVVRAQKGWFAALVFWACFGLAVLVLGVLAVRWLSPDGVKLGPAQAPRLRALVESVAKQVGADPPHEISIGLEFNAFAAVVPRFGLYGASRRILTIGMPLLAALREDELRALLAHELAHHGRHHLRGAMRLLRVRVAWTGLDAFIESTPHWGRFLLAPFARWYVPRLELYAEAMSRINEFEADRAAASVSRDAAARLLVRMAVWQRFLVHEVYPAVRRPSADRAHPDGGSLARMLETLDRGPSAEQTARWLRAALADRTLASHSHPSLSDRLHAIGEPAPADEAAMGALVAALGERGPRAVDLLDGGALQRKLGSEWEHTLSLSWRVWSADAATWKSVESLPAAEWPELAIRARARWSADCLPPLEAEPHVRALLERAPGDLEGAALLGVLLLGIDCREAEGESLLETTIASDSRAAAVAAEQLLAYYERVGASDAATHVRRRQRSIQRRILRAAAERQRLRSDDRIAPHALGDATREQIRRACAPRAEIERAWVVRKHTRLLRDQPLVVLAVQGRRTFRDDGSQLQAVCNELLTRVALPERADLLVAVVPGRGALARRMKRMPAALVYERR